MTPHAASALAASGKLRLLILPENPLTNAQIDMLVPSASLASASAAGLDGGNKVFATNATKLQQQQGGTGSKSHFRKARRNWDEGEPAAAATTAANGTALLPDASSSGVGGGGIAEDYRRMRTSLTEALSDVSDREGLTDEELRVQVSKLKIATDSLPKEVAEHLK